MVMTSPSPIPAFLAVEPAFTSLDLGASSICTSLDGADRVADAIPSRAWVGVSPVGDLVDDRQDLVDRDREAEADRAALTDDGLPGCGDRRS